LKAMSTKVFTKTVEINGAVVTLLSLDGTSWSSSLADLHHFEAERREIRATAQRAFKRIGSNDRWGMSQGRKRRAG